LETPVFLRKFLKILGYSKTLWFSGIDSGITSGTFVRGAKDPRYATGHRQGVD